MSATASPLAHFEQRLAGSTAATALAPGLDIGIVDEIAVEHHPEVRASVIRALDGIRIATDLKDVSTTVNDVFDVLGVMRDSFGPKTWTEVVIPTVRAHHITALAHQDPWVQHSFLRPRGYPGDASLIDLVYRHPSSHAVLEAATPVGKASYSITIDMEPVEAVRNRRVVLAEKIDELAAAIENPHILSVACGHSREVELSLAFAQGRIGRFLATDQDPISLAESAKYRETLNDRIETAQISVRDLIMGRNGAKDLVGFDMVYAAGLYDYLPADLAAKFTANLFKRVKAGGKLLVPNLTIVGSREQAFMEACMDWYLIYRTRQEIEAFASLIPAEEIASIKYFNDPFVGYLEIERA